ncbi:hypothetical protein Scep_003673 [Stephania cephalantha]|uniref:Uncharacterized protein n=1 Tax=Stephania cephalantha TaxID=152367 RepID=A0AAP0KSJ7_9MAGN
MYFLTFSFREMLRMPLEELCLQIKSLFLIYIRPFLMRAIEPPQEEAITSAISVLYKEWEYSHTASSGQLHVLGKYRFTLNARKVHSTQNTYLNTTLSQTIVQARFEYWA